MKKKRKILICDDSSDFLALIEDVLLITFENIEVHSCENGLKAMELNELSDFDIFISDYDMGVNGGDGISFYENLRSHELNAPFILLSAHERDRFDSYLSKGDFFFQQKPLEPEELNDLLKNLIL